MTEIKTPADLVNISTKHLEFSRASEEDVLENFKTSLNGLSDKEANLRIKKYGFNEPISKKKYNPVLKFFSKFFNPLILLFLVIIGFSIYFNQIISAIFISFMVFISIIIDFTQEYSSQKVMNKLNDLIKTRVIVLRNGKEKDIDIKEIVPGDIIKLYAGDIIPADLRIINSKDLFINQATLTGESFPVEKVNHSINPKNSSLNEFLNLAFMGSSVASGTGIGVVIETGFSTEFGEISKGVGKERAQTSFDIGIRSFSFLMIRFIAVLILFIFGIIYFFKGGNIQEAILFSLAVAVGLAPEMLSMMVTINLSLGVKKMSKDKVIVRHLDSIQNFGAMDVLCTDKTGTLTMDEIALEKHCNINGEESEDVLKYAYLNSIYQTGLRNLIERAILRHKKISAKEYFKVDEVPFDFSRKILSVVVGNSKDHILISKGAPEEIYKRCTKYELNGRTYNIHKGIFSKFQKEYELLSSQGFVVLALAYKKINNKKNAYSKDDESDLILKGYLAFFDPPKPSVKKVISSLENYGVEIKILTGDNELVTKKICSEVGINIKGIITGANIEALDDKGLRIVVEKNTIFARLSSQQKERIILALRENNHVVGYLGDGINDASSLNSADVSISVNNAVDIAKESADIILLEKNLMVLMDGVIQGRRTFGNIIKYIKMGASSNFGNMLSMTGATLFLPFLPMLPVQVLFNNFLYDISQMTLPTDEVDEEYIKKPRAWNINYIKKFMLIIGPLSSIYDFLTFAVMLFVFKADPALFQTGWFVESLFTQTLVIYIIRTNKIPFIQSRPSKSLLLSTILILGFASIIPFTVLGTYLGFVPLSGYYFLMLFVMIITYLFLVQIVKTWIVKKYGYQ